MRFGLCPGSLLLDKLVTVSVKCPPTIFIVAERYCRFNRQQGSVSRLRVVRIFPQGQQSERNANERENHPTPFSRDFHARQRFARSAVIPEEKSGLLVVYSVSNIFNKLGKITVYLYIFWNLSHSSHSFQRGQAGSCCFSKQSICRNCSSVGCLKSVQFHNWFRLHEILFQLWNILGGAIQNVSGQLLTRPMSRKTV